MTIVNAMAKIIIAMALGFFLYKIGIFNKETNSKLSRLVVDITSPCLIFSSIVTMDSGRKGDVWSLLIAGFAIYAFLGLLAFIMVRIMRIKKNDDGVYQAMIIFGNVGFLGLPLSQALYGDLGIFYMAILNIHLNLFLYSYCIYLVTKGKVDGFKFSAKKLLNPGITGVVLALIIFLLGIKVPDVIYTPISFVGSITSPLAMMVLGSSIAVNPLKNLFTNGRAYIIMAVKMILLPVLAFVICLAIWGPCEMTSIVTIYVGMPTAAAVGMMALTYGGDVDTATSGIGLMNILCVVTIPLMWLMINAVK